MCLVEIEMFVGKSLKVSDCLYPRTDIGAQINKIFKIIVIPRLWSVSDWASVYDAVFWDVRNLRTKSIFKSLPYFIWHILCFANF